MRGGASASSASAINPSFTWSGQSTSDGNWSTAGNWSGTGPAPNDTATTFDFPALTGCSPPKACFTSTNDVSGLSANTLHIDLTGAYDIGGAQPLTLTGGLTTVGSGGSANLTLPLEASGANLWSITGDLTVGGTITSADLTKAFSIDMADSAATLGLSADDEVGNVTAAPPGPTANNGVDAPANGTITLFGAGQLNGSDNQSVTLDQVALAGAGTVGALTSNGGELQVGNGGPIGTPGKLIVAGTGLTLDSNSATVFTLKNGTANAVPGTDFGQLNTVGSASLDGALEILLNHFSCPTLQIGAVYTLVQVGGSLSGRFSNAPDGTVIATPNATGCGAGVSFRINYTAQTVTATVVSNGPPGGSTAPPGGTPVGQTLPATAALVSSSSESNKKFRIARNFRAVTVSRARPPVGTTFVYTLDKPAAVRFDFTQSAPGRRANGRCVKPNRHNKHKRRCTRIVVRGSLSFAGHAGRNTVNFYGWLSRHHRLKPGRYTLVITATTPGVGSTSQKLKFTIVR